MTTTIRCRACVALWWCVWLWAMPLVASAQQPPRAAAGAHARSLAKQKTRASRRKRKRKQKERHKAAHKRAASAHRPAASDASTSHPPAAAAAAAATADVDEGAVRTEGGKSVKSVEFSGLDIEGQLKTPQMLFFLNRLRAEFDRPRLPHRSFIPELTRSRQDKEL